MRRVCVAILTTALILTSWSSLPENNNQGNELLHNSFAQFYWNVKDYSQAEKHFLRGSIPQE